MTYEELDALPETGAIGCREEIRDGKRVRIPVLQDVGPLYQGPDDVMFVRDSKGVAWMTGWANGKLYKRRLGL